MTDPSIKLIRPITDQRSGYSVDDLPNQDGIGNRVNKQHLFEKVDKIVEPACGYEVVESMADCVGLDVMFGEPIEGILVYCGCYFDMLGVLEYFLGGTELRIAILHSNYDTYNLLIKSIEKKSGR